jgi:hypothetical protein
MDSHGFLQINKGRQIIPEVSEILIGKYNATKKRREFQRESGQVSTGHIFRCSKIG